MCDQGSQLILKLFFLALIFEEILLVQSSKQPQGGSADQAVKAAGTTGSRKVGRNNGLPIPLRLLILCLIFFSTSVKLPNGIGWWPMGYDLRSSGPPNSPFHSEIHSFGFQVCSSPWKGGHRPILRQKKSILIRTLAGGRGL